LSYSKTVQCKTKAATVIVVHDGTFSDHTREYVEVYGLGIKNGLYDI